VESPKVSCVTLISLSEMEKWIFPIVFPSIRNVAAYSKKLKSFKGFVASQHHRNPSCQEPDFWLLAHISVKAVPHTETLILSPSFANLSEYENCQIAWVFFAVLWIELRASHICYCFVCFYEVFLSLFFR
jgi:hypothetical protein